MRKPVNILILAIVLAFLSACGEPKPQPETPKNPAAPTGLV